MDAWGSDYNEDRLVQGLTYRRMRLVPNSEVVSDSEFQNAKRCSSIKANAMCSDIDGYDDHHFLILDIDYQVEVLKSSSNNNHIVFGRAIDTKSMNKVLAVMAEVGLVQKTWADNAIANGYATLRAPGIQKHAVDDSLGFDEHGNIETPEKFKEELNALKQRTVAKINKQENEEW